MSDTEGILSEAVGKAKHSGDQRLRVAGLFAGIGGIECGLSSAGHESALLCELDPGAARVLKRRADWVNWRRTARRLGARATESGRVCSPASACARIESGKSLHGNSRTARSTGHPAPAHVLH